MAGQVSQAESDRYYRRLINTATALQGVYEEVKRLQSEKDTLDLVTNLDEESSGILTKAEAVAYFGVLADFESWYENATVAADGVENSNTRRGKVNPFLAAEPLVS